MQRDVLELWAGEQKTFSLVARTPAQAVKDLTGCAVDFRIQSRFDDGYSQGQWVGTVTNAAAGTYTVTLSASDTQHMTGDYDFIAYATAASIPVAVNVGTLRVHSGARI